MAQNLRYSIMIRLYAEEKFFGPGIAELLEKVDEYHSLRQATISMNMAYSKAWSIVKTAEKSLSFPLIITKTGGKGGGGAELSDRGRRFLKAYRNFEKTVHDYADEIFEDMFGEDE